MFKQFCSILILVFMMGCKVNKPIKYKLKNIEANSEKSLSELVFDVEYFLDKRNETIDNMILFANPRNTKIDGVNACVNSERHYKKSPVTVQLVEALNKHLIKRNTFKRALVNKKDSADFYITASLFQFSSKQVLSSAAVVGAQFGLIGALATANAKTYGKVVIELRDIKLFNRKHELLKDIGKFRREYEGDFHADANCWCAFDNINAKLREYNTEFINLIEKEILVKKNKS